MHQVLLTGDTTILGVQPTLWKALNRGLLKVTSYACHLHKQQRFHVTPVEDSATVDSQHGVLPCLHPHPIYFVYLSDRVQGTPGWPPTPAVQTRMTLNPDSPPPHRCWDFRSEYCGLAFSSPLDSFERQASAGQSGQSHGVETRGTVCCAPAPLLS